MIIINITVNQYIHIYTYKDNVYVITLNSIIIHIYININF